MEPRWDLTKIKTAVVLTLEEHSENKQPQWEEFYEGEVQGPLENLT